MLTIAAGPQVSIDAGAAADVPHEFARELVARGFAEALEPFPSAEPEAPPEPEPTAADPDEAPEPEPTAVPEADKPSRKKGR